MTITVNYEKRKNTELFKSLEKMGFEKPQNYIPIYKNFFVLNDTNFSSVNLNHTHYIDKLQKSLNDNVHQCLIKVLWENHIKMRYFLNLLLFLIR